MTIRWAVPVFACLALLAVPAQATPVHGVQATDATLFVHFAGEDRLPMQPMVPQGYVLPDAPDLGEPECGTSLSWTAVFTQVPVGDVVTWTQGLGRDTEFGVAKPKLTWFVETVQPGGSDPLALPVADMRLRAELRTGDDPAAAGQGRLLAQGTIEATPSAVTVEGRSVHKFDLLLGWNNQTVLAAEGLHMLIVLDMGHEDCRVAPPALRAYADAGHRPQVRVSVYDPVVIDLLEPRLEGDAWSIVWHASSPWGRHDLAQPEAPQVRGPAGEAPVPRLVSSGDGAALETVWAWDPAGGPNGTYRIDVALNNTAGTAAATANAIFQVGSTSRDEPAPAATPGKKSPAPALPLVLGAALALRRISRR